VSKSKPIGGGRWMPTPPAEHECKPPPILWGAKAGQRWQCARPVGHRADVPLLECGRIWIIRMIEGRKTWMPELDEGPRVHVFREATDAQVCYWLGAEFDNLRQYRDPLEVVEALRKHFTIGVQS
jgi:hypothetical protein